MREESGKVIVNETARLTHDLQFKSLLSKNAFLLSISTRHRVYDHRQPHRSQIRSSNSSPPPFHRKLGAVIATSFCPSFFPSLQPRWKNMPYFVRAKTAR